MLALFPIILGAGVAVDYSRAVGARTSMLGVADSASISAVRTLNAEYNRLLAIDGNEDKAWNAARRVAGEDARALLNGNQVLKNDLSYTSEITFTRDGNRVLARVDVTGTMNSAFMRLLGKSTLSISAASESEASLSGTVDKPVYADVYILLDRSPSMLVGESPHDVALTRAVLPNEDGQPCAFACHKDASDKNDPYNRVKANSNIRLKYDVAREAIANFTATAKPDFHRIAVYGVGHDWRKAKDPLVSLSNSMTSVASAIRGIAPETASWNSQTEISYSMMQFYNEVLSKLPRSEDGSSGSKRKIFLVLITDGVESIHHQTDWYWQDKGEPKWPWYGHPVNRTAGAPYMMGYWSLSGTQITRHDNSGDRQSVCKLIKDRVDVAVLEVQYPDITGLDKEQKYEKLVKNTQGRISGSLRDCASPSLYFKASSMRGAIDSAAQALFKAVTSEKRTTLQLVR